MISKMISGMQSPCRNINLMVFEHFSHQGWRIQIVKRAGVEINLVEKKADSEALLRSRFQREVDLWATAPHVCEPGSPGRGDDN
jgi:hypothetical protein